MKEIPLTQGQVAIVDDKWFEYLNQWKWYAHRDSKNGKFYAYRNSTVPEGEKRRTVHMHHEIIGKPLAGMDIDHRDGNGCNNAECNLYIVPKSKNQWNTGIRKDNTSGFKGVSWHSHDQRWYGHVQEYGKRFFTIRFRKLSDAVYARNELAKKLHEDVAYQNHIPD